MTVMRCAKGRPTGHCDFLENHPLEGQRPEIHPPKVDSSHQILHQPHVIEGIKTKALLCGIQELDLQPHPFPFSLPSLLQRLQATWGDLSLSRESLPRPGSAPAGGVCPTPSPGLSCSAFGKKSSLGLA